MMMFSHTLQMQIIFARIFLFLFHWDTKNPFRRDSRREQLQSCVVLSDDTLYELMNDSVQTLTHLLQTNLVITNYLSAKTQICNSDLVNASSRFSLCFLLSSKTICSVTATIYSETLTCGLCCAACHKHNTARGSVTALPQGRQVTGSASSFLFPPCGGSTPGTTCLVHK